MKLRMTMIVLLLSLVQVMNVWAVTPKVYDEANLLTEVERDSLEEAANELSEITQLDIVLVTTNDTGGKTSRAYADDFYDYNGFGYGDEADGLLLLINMQDREVYISTTGLAIRYFTDARIEAILDSIYIQLGNGQYATAMRQFLTEVRTYVAEGIPEGQYSVDENETSVSASPSTSNSSSNTTGSTNELTASESSVDIRQQIFTRLMIAFGVAAVIVGIMALSNRGLKVTNEKTYLKDNSFKVTNQVDVLVDTDLTYSVIPKQTNSSAKSTTHRSSSGRTHGGGGRKF